MQGSFLKPHFYNRVFIRYTRTLKNNEAHKPSGDTLKKKPINSRFLLSFYVSHETAIPRKKIRDCDIVAELPSLKKWEKVGQHHTLPASDRPGLSERTSSSLRYR